MSRHVTGRPLFTLKFSPSPFKRGALDSYLIHASLGLHKSTSQMHLNQLRHFCRAYDHDREADQPTERPCYTVCSNWLRQRSTAMHPQNVLQSTSPFHDAHQLRTVDFIHYSNGDWVTWSSNQLTTGVGDEVNNHIVWATSSAVKDSIN